MKAIAVTIIDCAGWNSSRCGRIGLSFTHSSHLKQVVVGVDRLVAVGSCFVVVVAYNTSYCYTHPCYCDDFCTTIVCGDVEWSSM